MKKLISSIAVMFILSIVIFPNVMLYSNAQSNNASQNFTDSEKKALESARNKLNSGGTIDDLTEEEKAVIRKIGGALGESVSEIGNKIEDIFESMDSSSDFWGKANDWYSKGKNEYDGNVGNLAEENATVKKIVGEFEKMVNIIGTTVIVCVTTFLGIKYMFGSASAKSDVKDNLLTLLVACIFFFGWNAIWNIIFVPSTGGIITNEGGYINVVGNIFSIVSLLANILAVGAVIYIGIRYIFAGAIGKAELKGKSYIFLIGLILAFCSVGVLNYISSVINEILK